jgi:hypothetical protein
MESSPKWLGHLLQGQMYSLEWPVIITGVAGFIA